MQNDLHDHIECRITLARTSAAGFVVSAGNEGRSGVLSASATLPAAVAERSWKLRRDGRFRRRALAAFAGEYM